MIDSINNTVFKDMKIITRNQLHNYPNIKTKECFKVLIKNLVKKRTVKINDKFFWPNGLLSISLEWSHRRDADEEDLEALKKYYDEWIKRGVPMSNSDYAINGYTLIYLYNLKQNKEYLNTIELLVGYLKNHTKTNDGSLPYRESRKSTVFVDSLGMICPFLCRYGNLSSDNYATELAIKQLTNFLEQGMDNNSSLPYHGYDSSNQMKLGIIGWGRAVGWLLIGLVDSLEYISNTHPKYEFLCEEFSNIVLHALEYQRKDGTFSWQLTAREGYADSSSTSMISYAIKRGVMLNLLPDKLSKKTNLALNSLYGITRNGFVQGSSAECRGIGMYPQRYSNNPWAQGPTTSLSALSVN